MSLRLGRQCCHRSFRNATTGEKRKRIFRDDVVSRFGRGEEEPPPPASDRGVWSRENARARRDPHQNTHPPVLEHYSQTIIIFGGFPKTVRYTARRTKMQRAIFPRKSRRDANETSRPSPAIRAARSFLFPKSYNKNAVVLFSNPRRGMSWTLSDSFCVANLRAFFNVSSRHFFLPSSAFQKRALFPREYIRSKKKKNKREK